MRAWKSKPRGMELQKPSFKKKLGFKNHILLRWSARTKRLAVSKFYLIIRHFLYDSD